MDIIKIIGIGLTSLIIIVIVKQYRPEFVLYVSLAAGILILGMTFDTISQIVGVINDYTNKASIHNKFVIVLLKITGIAILAEFATSICKDAGESAIANKIEVAGKIVVVAISVPVVASLIEIVTKLVWWRKYLKL